jgi:hypothetical protein
LKKVTAKLSGKTTFIHVGIEEIDKWLRPFKIKCPDSLVLTLSDALVERIVSASEIAAEFEFKQIEFYSEGLKHKRVGAPISSFEAMRDGVIVEPAQYTSYDDKRFPVFENQFFNVLVTDSFVFGPLAFIELLISNDGANEEIILDFEFKIGDLLE